MGNWITACKLADIEAKGVVRFDHGGRTYAIYRSANTYRARTEGTDVRVLL